MFKVYYTNMLNVTYYVAKMNSIHFEYHMSMVRSKMSQQLISGWQIQRASDGVIIAQSKGMQS